MKHYSGIETDRLILRKLGDSDWKMISYLRSDKEVNEFVKRPSAESKEKALGFISKINHGIDNQNFYYWAITQKNSNDMIGSICLWNFSQDKLIGEIGYDLSPEFQKKGIMSESMKSVLGFGFHKLNLNVIEAFTHRLNESSKILLAKNGFSLIKDKRDEDNLDNLVYEIKTAVNYE